MLEAGSSGVAMAVTQPLWPFRVARSVIVSAMFATRCLRARLASERGRP